MATFVIILRNLTWSIRLKWFISYCHKIESDCLVISPPLALRCTPFKVTKIIAQFECLTSCLMFVAFEF